MAERATVLAIDDDEIVLLAMTDVLEGAGLHVITRTSPIGVTRVIMEDNVDVIVIDINMPVMQGDAVVRLLQSWDKFREVPVVIVSGIATTELAEVKTRVGDVPIVHKKKLGTDLVRVVNECLLSRSAKPATRSAADSDRVIDRFVTELGVAMVGLRKLWSDYASGVSRDRKPLQAEVRKLLSRAQLLGLTDVERVLSRLDATLTAPKFHPTPSLSQAVHLCTRALEGANRRDGSLPVSCQGLVDGIARAMNEA